MARRAPSARGAGHGAVRRHRRGAPRGRRPAEARIRASVLRWIILGAEGAPGRTHEKGVRVFGAVIESDGPAGAGTRGLDLEGCTVAHDIALLRCRFEDPPLLRSARLAGLFLNGAHLPGLKADGLTTTGNVFLCAAGAARFESDGEIRLLGARIGGDLACNGAALRNETGVTLNADRLTTTGDVFLRAVGDARFESDGEIRLLGARIGGDLACVGAALRNPEGRALSADGARIAGAFFLRDGASVAGVLNLSAAEIGSINDDPDCWPRAHGEIVLDRCVYGAFLGGGVDARTRIAWLDRQDPAQFGQAFWPQPWEQCATVLREMGHAEDARAVLIEKEARQRAARRGRMPRGTARFFRGLWDGLMGVTVRYGRLPTLAFAWLAGFWLVGAAMFDVSAGRDAIKPNNAFVLRSAEWVRCGTAEREPIDASFTGEKTGLREGEESRLDCYARQPEAEGFPEFNALIYSLDTLLPVVSMEMQGFWIPDEDVRDLGLIARLYLWLHIALGWALSLLAVAGFSGLVKSD